MNFHKYSIEYVFRNSSVPNIFIDMVKEFNYKYQMDNSIKGLLSAKEDWTIFSKYMNMLCEELKGLLMCEDKLIKLNSPAVVVGDLQGNLNDLFSVESSYFQSSQIDYFNFKSFGRLITKTPLRIADGILIAEK